MKPAMYKYIFGPVPSRRLGMSLGIDLIPRKICSLDCIYCEVGETTTLTLKRNNEISADDVISEIISFFKENLKPDYVTITGSGEPTLSECIKQVIQFIKSTYPEMKVAVITNGTLFYNKRTRLSVLDADIILPSLDAATDEAFRLINRPVKNYTVNKHINGLIEFRNVFSGKIFLEVFIVPGINDAGKELLALRNAISLIRPDKVQLNTLDRPGVVSALKSASLEALNLIAEFIGLDNVEIISAVKFNSSVMSSKDNITKKIVEITSRRPCTVDDFLMVIDVDHHELSNQLNKMADLGILKVTSGERGIFYSSK